MLGCRQVLCLDVDSTYTGGPIEKRTERTLGFVALRVFRTAEQHIWGTAQKPGKCLFWLPDNITVKSPTSGPQQTRVKIPVSPPLHL